MVDLFLLWSSSMNLRMFATLVAVAGLVSFTQEASAQRFGRRVQYSQPQVQSYSQPASQTHVHTYQQPSSQHQVISAGYASGSSHSHVALASYSGNATAQMMLDRNNQIRGSRGMPAQRLSDRLTNAAQQHASYMARTGQFSHNVNGSPQSRAAMFGFTGGVRENIAMGQTSVSGAFQDWVNSSGHYTNLMSQTNAAGFGYAVNSSGQGFWVAMYGNE
jgi:uncharacterized protein YkwD